MLTGLENESAFPSNISKFDIQDIDLDGLLAKNKIWAKSVLQEDPNFFKRIANIQKPKILWIGKELKQKEPIYEANNITFFFSLYNGRLFRLTCTSCKY